MFFVVPCNCLISHFKDHVLDISSYRYLLHIQSPWCVILPTFPCYLILSTGLSDSITILLLPDQHHFVVLSTFPNCWLTSARFSPCTSCGSDVQVDQKRRGRLADQHIQQKRCHDSGLRRLPVLCKCRNTGSETKHQFNFTSRWVIPLTNSKTV